MAKLPATPPNQAEHLTSENSIALKIEEAIEKELEGKVARRDLPTVARKITAIAVSEQFSGPMPHPKHLREYDEILPGSAERILSMAEKNLDHNIAMNSMALGAEIDDAKRGMLLGAALFAMLILGAFLSLFITDSEIIPGIFLGAAVIGGVGAFIRGRNGGK